MMCRQLGYPSGGERAETGNSGEAKLPQMTNKDGYVSARLCQEWHQNYFECDLKNERAGVGRQNDIALKCYGDQTDIGRIMAEANWYKEEGKRSDREEGKRRDGDDDDRRRGDDDRRRGDDDRRGGEEEKMEYPDGMFPCKDYQCPGATMAVAPIGCGPTPMVQ